MTFPEIIEYNISENGYRKLKNIRVAMRTYEFLLKREPRTVIAGGFVAYLLGFKDSYGDIDIFLPFSEDLSTSIRNELIPQLESLEERFVSEYMYSNKEPEENVAYDTHSMYDFLTYNYDENRRRFIFTKIVNIVFEKKPYFESRRDFIGHLTSRFDLNLSRCAIDSISYVVI